MVGENASMSTTHSLTMAHVKPEVGDSALWQGYNVQHPPLSAVTQPPGYDTNYHSSAATVPYHARPQKGMYRSMDMPSNQSRGPSREIVGGILTASPPTLSTHHSYPSLKRAFHTSDELPYGENVQNFREDIQETPKPTINQDHRLLSFGRLPEKHTILDTQGHAQHLDLVAQIHGMFFLSELATPSGESLLVQPELTCYRRNLFQISGSVTTPRGNLSIMTERGDRIPIVSMEVTIGATESVDGHVVKLIVIPWKTPPPNSPEIPTGQEQEPASIPLVPFDEGPDANNDFTVFPIAYRRLQFRIATANNGRRRELQQHFTLHLNVVGTLANGTKLNICETSTAPIVVRGRSPRNFQARKEIPLVGSSSSRGQPPELHVATNMNSTVDAKMKLAKPHGIELPRSPFTFDSNNISGSPSLIRQPTYSTWSAAQSSDHTTSPNTPNYSVPPVGMDSYLQVNNSTPDLQANTHSPTSVNTTTSRQYYHPASAPAGGEPMRFLDNNPRPAKSPRHVAPPDIASNYPEYGTRFAPPYGGGNNEPLPSRAPEYFPPALPLQPWSTSGPSTGVVYGTAPGVPHYEFPLGHDQYAKTDAQPGHYTWNHS